MFLKTFLVKKESGTTQKLEGQTLIDFLKNKQILCFDEQDAEAKLSDIDENKIKHYLSLRDQQDYLKSNSIKDFIINNLLGKEKGVFRRTSLFGYS